MRPTSVSGAQYATSRWSDTAPTRRWIKRAAHKADRAEVRRVVLEELDGGPDGSDLFVSFVPALPTEDIFYPNDPLWDIVNANTPCGGTCRRCVLHDDPGGCVG